MFEWINSKGSKNRRDYGSFKFSLKSQPDVIDSSSTISLIAHTNGFGNATIPCIYRWSIIKNGVKIQRPQFKGSSYKCEPSDVGGLIQAEVKSTDMQYGGTAIVQFDLVKIDPNIKKKVQQALFLGCFSTTIHVIKGIEERQCQIKISEEAVQIKHKYSQANFNFQYSIIEPETQCLIKNSLSIMVHLKNKFQNQVKNFAQTLFQDPFKNLSSSNIKITGLKDSQYKNSQNNLQLNYLQLKFPTHEIRDIFLFVWKAFAVRKQLKKVSSNNRVQQKNMVFNQNFDYLLEIQTLKKQLLKMSETLNLNEIEKAQKTDEIKKLKQQINLIVKNYTLFIEEKFQQRTQYSNNSILSIEDQKQAKRYKNLQNQNNHLNSRIYALTKQIDTIRFQPLKLQSSVRHSVYQESQQKIIKSPNVNEKQGNSMNGSPFSKKKTNDQSQDFMNLVDDFQTSRISYLSEISSIHQNENEEMKQNGNFKLQLQKKLQRSYQKIDKLEEQLWKTRQELNTKNQKITQSAVNFSYNNNLNQSVCDISSSHNKTLNQSNPKRIALNDLRQIKKNAQGFKVQGRNLNEQFDKASNNNNYEEQKNLIKSNNKHNDSIRTQKKQPQFSQEQQKQQLVKQMSQHFNISKLQSLNYQLMKEKQALIKQNQMLIQQNKQITLQCQSLKKHQPQIKKLQSKIHSLQSEVQFYQKNMDALNRSQQLSIDSDSFNNEQINLLKRQNDFLTNQNEKLSKACQKYMNEAKQSNKLRMQITKMRSRIISEKLY